jgi:hypothetical protein
MSFVSENANIIFIYFKKVAEMYNFCILVPLKYAEALRNITSSKTHTF